jgi:mannan endo-1,4-beta-mannosidase
MKRVVDANILVSFGSIMRKHFLWLMAVPAMLSCDGLRAESVFSHFVTVRGDQLMEGGTPFRFISFNLPNLQMIEDNLPFAETNCWRLPDSFEIADGLMTLRQMGGTVARTYVLTVRRTNDAPDVPRHVLGPGQFNEDAFRQFDVVLQVANEQGVRLIIPLVDNWTWQGGRAEYAGFRGKSREDFWTDPQIIADFKETIRFFVLRTNTLTGQRYCDDKAILCWETGNELSSPAAWTREIAAYIKSLDTNHLVMDGFARSPLRAESLAMPEIDIVTTHHYPSWREWKSFAQLIRENRDKAKGRKPYVVGEFGFVSTEQMEDALKAIRDTGTAGGLVWSLRFRNRDGGFYWHSEPLGGNRYKGYHWPGSPIGAGYDEVNLLSMIRRYAFEIRGAPAPRHYSWLNRIFYPSHRHQAAAVRGVAPPAVPVPAPPRLLPIADAAAISWQGSIGARAYSVERAPKASGPWTVVGERIDESFVQYRPLFADESAPAGAWYYCVRASNDAGVSKPSNVFGPVSVTHATLVDELADFSKVHTRQGSLETATRDCRKVKEDAHRAAGSRGDALIYQLPTPVEGFRAFAFFPDEIADLKFAVSADGQEYRVIPATSEVFFTGAGDYRYWKPVRYRAGEISPDARFLKIELTGVTQIGRVEIDHAAAPE